MYDKYNHDPFAVDPRDFKERMRAHGTLVLGYRPSSRQLDTALVQFIMKDRKTDTESMMALARELFPIEQEEGNASSSPE